MTKISSKDLDGRELIKRAHKAGLRVERGKGDHVNVFGPQGRGYMTIPQRELGKGLACTIIKWLIAAGVSFGGILLIFCN